MPPGYDEAAAERWSLEPPKRSGRTPFERDRARVLHSSALRRLAAKTQVLGPASDDFVRNRLTHSLEVAQVGRELGAALGCDPDVVDTACLAHDLGHPPFGHTGERALDELAGPAGGFEGNAQTLRLLTRLEPKAWDDGRDRSVGLNLTRASLDAATKYPWRRGEQPGGGPKYGVYDDDLEVFAWLRGRPGPDLGPRRRCLEAQVMDVADDVAYATHDVEDAVVGGWFDPASLEDAELRARVAAVVQDWYDPAVPPAAVDDALDRLRALPCWVGAFDGSARALAALKDMTSQLIGRACRAVEAATRAEHGDGLLTRYAADLVVPEPTRLELLALKGIAAALVMTSSDRLPVHERQRQVVHDLVTDLLDRGPDALDPPAAAAWRAAPDDAARLRAVLDAVASLTDVSALHRHAQLRQQRRARSRSSTAT